METQPDLFPALRHAPSCVSNFTLSLVSNSPSDYASENSIMLQQIISGPTQIYVRSAPSDSFVTSAYDEDLDELARARSPRRIDEQLYTPSSDPVASGFSRLSYSIPSHPNGYVDDDENIELLDKGKGDGVIGAMFGKSLRGQLSSSWFW